MTLRNNDTQVLRIWKKTVQRLSFIANLIGAGTNSTVSFDLVNVKIVLRRAGREYVIAHENLQLLAQESAYFNSFGHAFAKETITISGTHKLLPMMVDLGSPVNLMGDDELIVEVTTKPGWYGDFDASQSSLEVEYREAIGVEYAIPFVKSKAIPATTSRVVESLGDNITSIMLLNTEADRDNSDSEKVYEAFLLTSDKYNTSDNRARLLGRRASQFDNTTTAAARGENFRYVPNVELDNVTLTLELKGVNVVSTKNFIVYRTFQPTNETVNRAQQLSAKHDARNADKLSSQL